MAVSQISNDTHVDDSSTAYPTTDQLYRQARYATVASGRSQNPFVAGTWLRLCGRIWEIGRGTNANIRDAPAITFCGVIAASAAMIKTLAFKPIISVP
jgi:hypothetical protein